MIRRPASLSLLALLWLCSCFGTGDFDDLKRLAPSGGSFSELLAKHYLRFAESEVARYDWWSAEYFAEKGLRAVRGEAMEPESLEAWDIPDYAQESLRMARASVMDKLTADYRANYPQKAADLLFYFDCWVEEQEEAWDINAIDRCKNQVLRQMEETDPPIPMGGPIATSFLFYFPWDATRLEDAAQEELEDISNVLNRHPGQYHIVINGHADRSGDNDYNLELSARRAQSIRAFLMREGVPSERIKYFAFGESDPEVPTPDGTREMANRRVEIFIE